MIRSGDPYRPRRSYMARWVFTGHCSHVISQRRLDVHFSRETNACPPPKRSGLLANTPETSLYFTSSLPTFRWFTDDFHGFPDTRGVFPSCANLSSAISAQNSTVPAAGTSARTMAGLVRWDCPPGFCYHWELNLTNIIGWKHAARFRQVSTTEQLRRAASCQLQKAGERGFRKEWVESPYLFFFSHSVCMEALH